MSCHLTYICLTTKLLSSHWFQKVVIVRELSSCRQHHNLCKFRNVTFTVQVGNMTMSETMENLFHSFKENLPNAFANPDNVVSS